MPHIQKSIISLFLLGLLAGAALAALAADDFAVDGQKVTVTTPRYRITLDGLMITGVKNLLTGEIYAQPAADAAPSKALEQLAPRLGAAVESLRGEPTRFFYLAEGTKITQSRLPNGVRLTYTGLFSGAKAEPQMTLAVDLLVDPATGDLCLTPNIQGNIPIVAGTRDRGIERTVVQLRNLDEALKVILPVNDGLCFTNAIMGAKFATDRMLHFNWPMNWEAGLLIAEGQQGCMAVWADDAPMNYGRFLGLSKSAGRWHCAFEYQAAEIIDRSDAITHATWRVNVFPGYWAQAAARYQAQMQRQWPELKPLSARTPKWADTVRVVMASYIPDVENARKALALLPPGSVMPLFTSQGWLKGWNDNAIYKAGYTSMDFFPNWPLENPERYEGVDGIGKWFGDLEKEGLRVFPYTNSVALDFRHPWYGGKLHDRHHAEWRFWQRIYPELCQDIVKRYGVSGIYEDCSWVMSRRDDWGAPDGENWYNGSARMRVYFRQLLPEVALMGERRNEVTARSQHFALSITQWPGAAHPICSYLFDPYCRIWNLQLSPDGFDADDIRGFLTRWNPEFEGGPLQDRMLIRLRGQIFAREGLVNYWPEQWDPKVMHYYKGKDGTEFRFVRDGGTRFVKVTPHGEETLYWRLHGVTSREATGVGAEGWVGYDGDRILGLNPRVTYITLPTVRRPPATICALPEGHAISRSVVREDYWLAELDTLPRLARGTPGPSAPPEKVAGTLCTVRVRGDGKPLSFAGVETVTPAGPNEYDVQVKLPGGFATYWGAPKAVKQDTPLGFYATRGTIHRRDTGLIAAYGHSIRGQEMINGAVGVPENNDEGTTPWLVTLPKEAAWLVFQYGSGHPHGDGSNYAIRVNGKTVWKRYRPESSGFVDEKGEPRPVPLKTGAVDLGDYAGQTVVLELVVNGNHSGVSESSRWTRPMLKDAPPRDAEMDRPALEGPKETEL
jgi:hypothetical protein